MNGLRMALAWPPLVNEPWLNTEEEFFLLVQNVSEAAVRLTAGDAAPNPRRLMIRKNGSPLSALGDPTTMPGDWLLKPREVAFLRLFQTAEKTTDGRTTSAVIEDDIRAFPQYSMTAEMSIEKAPAGAWTGKLATGESRGSLDVIPPQHKDAQALYRSWTTAARTDGNIPGALIGLLADSVRLFIKNNPTWETVPQLEKMLPRLDASHDWAAQDAVALLDELAALQDSPISMALDHDAESVIRTGAPLPQSLADAPWGKEFAGLRVAYLMEPRAAEHYLNTPLKGRILIHNAGKEPVVFRTRGWHQLGHTATDAKGAEIAVESTSWTTRGLLTPFRLAPGEYVERNTPGIGVGKTKNDDDWQEVRVGSWLDVKPGDEVTVKTSAVPLYDWNEQEQLKLDGEPRWWLDHIKTRLSRHLPFPADKDGRERLLYRVAMELFGTPYNDAAFVADTTPGAFDALALRIFDRAGQKAWAGALEPAPTKFRVLPADPDAAKRPRTAYAPGRYTLGENVRLVVTRRPDGERIVNDGSVTYFPPGKDNIPHDLKLPDGYDTWAAVWEPGTTVMWMQKLANVFQLARYDFTDPANVKEHRYTQTDVRRNPPDMLWNRTGIALDVVEALRAALPAADAPNQIEKLPPPATPASAPPASEASEDGADRKQPPLARDWPQPPWGAERDGLSAGLHIFGDAHIGGEVKVELWVRNSGAKNVTFSWNPRTDMGLLVIANDKDGKEHQADITQFRGKAFVTPKTVPAGQVVNVKTFTLHLDAERSDELRRNAASFHLPAGDYKLRAKWSDSVARVAPAGEWSGELTSGEVDLKIAEADVPWKAGADAAPGAKPAVQLAKLPDDAYPKSGVPIGELDKPMEWSGKETNGVCLGLHIPEEAAWRVGGEMKVEVWARNAGKTDVKFSRSPRTDVGLSVIAKGADGKEHLADITQFRGYPVFTHMLLPAGHVVKLKEFTIKLGAKKDDERVNLDLPPGDYKLRAVWSDTTSMVAPEGEWTGKIATGEVDLKIVAADAPKTAGTNAEVPKPERTHLFNDKYAAIAVQSKAGVNFVLVYNGALSSGMSETWSETTKRWTFEGNVHLVDREKTKAAGKNVDKRVIALKYTSDAPATLFLDGKAYDLAAQPRMTSMGALEEAPGRIFLLRDEGEPLQTGRTLALRNEKDLVTIGDFAAHDRFLAEHYADSRRVRAMEGWVLSWDTQYPIRHGDGELVAQMRIFPEGRVLSLSNGRQLKEFKITPDELAELLRWLVEEGDVGEWKPTKVKIANTGQEVEISPIQNQWDRTTDTLYFTRDGKRHGIAVESGTPGAKAFDAIRNRLTELSVKGAAAAPERVKFPDEEYAKDGFPLEDLNGEGVMWDGAESGLSLSYRITGDEWRILGKEVKVELWMHNAGKEDVKFQNLSRTDEGLRVKLTDKDGKEHVATMVPNDRPLFGMGHRLSPKQCIKVNEFSVTLLPPEQSPQIDNDLRFFVPPGWYQLVCEVDVPGFTATRGDGRQTVPGAGEWTGTLKSRSKNVEVVAQDAPPPKPRVEWMNVEVSRDGGILLNRKKMTLDELKAKAALHVADWRIVIDADKAVPYAVVVKVADVLHEIGADFSYRDGRMGDARLRVANLQANYEFDGKHKFSMCRPGEHPQWFTVMWPEEGAWPKCWLRTYPNVNAEHGGKWAVAWGPGTDVLWWVDDTDVGKMTLTDPARVIVNREGRMNNFSRDFGLPEEVKTEFRRLGFVIGRDKTPGLENVIGGNTGGQSIVAAEFGMWSIEGTVTDADGLPLANVPVRVITNQELNTETTDEKGHYRAYFALNLKLLAHGRAVTVEPVLEGFTERDMAQAGEFNVLLREGEQPQRVQIDGDTDFQPGPISRFAARDLLPSLPGVSPGNPGRADFVMLKAGEITGVIVTADGLPAPGHWIAAATPEQRPGHNAAIAMSDANGHFRLKGIPINKPVIFTVNPDGNPGETNKSSDQTFEQTGTHKVVIRLPQQGSGKGRLEVNRVAD